MNRRSAIVGLCMLCGLLMSAFAAQSASAIKGTTAVTCKKGAGDTEAATYSTAHCRPTDGAGEWGHYKIAENTPTDLTIRAGSATTKIKSTTGGVGTTLTSTELSGTGSLENRIEVGGVNDKEHFAHGTISLVLKNVTVSPFTKCIVYTDDGTVEPKAQGVIDTEQLTVTTTQQGDKIKMVPVNPLGIIAKVWTLDKNKVGAGGECSIWGTHLLTGSVVLTPQGVTAEITHEEATTQNTLKMGSSESEATVKAGIEGSLTIEGRDPKVEGDTYKPLSFTTYST